MTIHIRNEYGREMPNSKQKITRVRVIKTVPGNIDTRESAEQ
jgi:hypothetical protein